MDGEAARVIDFTKSSNTNANTPTKKRKSVSAEVTKKAPKKKKQKSIEVEAEGFSTALNTILSKEVDGNVPILPGVHKVDLEREEDQTKKKRERALAEERKLLKNKDHRVLTRESENYSKEAAYKKTATAGVVQLFNAVSNYQKTQQNKKKKKSEGLTKDKFLELLNTVKPEGSATQKKTDKPSGSKKESKTESSKEGVKWGVLSDDYMLGAKMNDWKEADDGSKQQLESGSEEYEQELEVEQEMESDEAFGSESE